MDTRQPQRPGKSATATNKTLNKYTSQQVKSFSRPHCDRSILTHSEVCAQLQLLGFQHTERVPASGMARIPARGKNHRNRSASVKWTDDMGAMHWYEFTTDDSGTLFGKIVNPTSKAESARRFKDAENRRRKQEADRIESQQRVARIAQDKFRAGVVDGRHDYISRKGLADLYKTRIDSATGGLMIPMWVSGIGFVNLQCIWPDGTKRFLKGGRVTGAYSVIGSLNGAERVYICEGWATGAVLFELLGMPVVVAFNAGNLMAVSQSLRSRFENLTIVIAGDDDRQNTVNTGRQKAIQAAEAVGATLLFPALCKCCKCTDHSDLMLCRRRSVCG